MSDSPTPRTDAVQADLGKDHEDMVLHAEKLELENAALRKDAERYWYLRDKHEWYECYITNTMQTKFHAKYETLDEAIDAAMEPQQL